MDGREEIIKKHVSANKQLEQLLNKILGEEAMKQMADPCFGVVPKEPKKIGDKWNKVVKLSLGPLGTYGNTYTFTYVKQTGDNAEIDVAVDWYTPPGGQGGETCRSDQGRQDRAIEGRQVQQGKIVFNAKLGRIESSKFPSR